MCGMIVIGENQSTQRKACSSAISPITNCTWISLVSNPGFFSEGLVTASVVAWPVLHVIATG